MSDQTILYTVGTLVWCKVINRIWWPGEIVDPKTPPLEFKEFMSRKNVIAVVYFENDEKFEAVINKKNLYLYSCDKKMQFIEKGYSIYLGQKMQGKFIGGINMNQFLKDVINFEKRINDGNLHIFDKLEEKHQEKMKINMDRKQIVQGFTPSLPKQKKIKNKNKNKNKTAIENIQSTSFETPKTSKSQLPPIKTKPATISAQDNIQSTSFETPKTSKSQLPPIKTKPAAISAQDNIQSTSFETPKTSKSQLPPIKTEPAATPTQVKIQYPCYLENGCDFRTRSYTHLKRHTAFHLSEKKELAIKTNQLDDKKTVSSNSSANNILPSQSNKRKNNEVVKPNKKLMLEYDQLKDRVANNEHLKGNVDNNKYKNTDDVENITGDMSIPQDSNTSESQHSEIGHVTTASKVIENYDETVNENIVKNKYKNTDDVENITGDISILQDSNTSEYQHTEIGHVTTVSKVIENYDETVNENIVKNKYKNTDDVENITGDMSIPQDSNTSESQHSEIGHVTTVSEVIENYDETVNENIVKNKFMNTDDVENITDDISIPQDSNTSEYQHTEVGHVTTVSEVIENYDETVNENIVKNKYKNTDDVENITDDISIPQDSNTSEYQHTEVGHVTTVSEVIENYDETVNENIDNNKYKNTDDVENITSDMSIEFFYEYSQGSDIFEDQHTEVEYVTTVSEVIENSSDTNVEEYKINPHVNWESIIDRSNSGSVTEHVQSNLVNVVENPSINLGNKAMLQTEPTTSFITNDLLHINDKILVKCGLPHYHIDENPQTTSNNLTKNDKIKCYLNNVQVPADWAKDPLWLKISNLKEVMKYATIDPTLVEEERMRCFDIKSLKPTPFEVPFQPTIVDKISKFQQLATPNNRLTITHIGDNHQISSEEMKDVLKMIQNHVEKYGKHNLLKKIFGNFEVTFHCEE